MAKTTKLLASPISRIRSLRTGAVVGWVYRWDTGEIQTMWLQEEHGSVTYESLDGVASERPENAQMQHQDEPGPEAA